MRASFDGARRQLAAAFNRLNRTELSREQEVEMARLRDCIGGLLCMYDDGCPDDCNDLSGSVKLDEPKIPRSDD